MEKHKINEKTQKSWKKQKYHEKTTFSQNAATALGPSSKDRARCEVSAGIKDLSVRPLSVEFRRFEVSNRMSAPMSYITVLYVEIIYIMCLV